LVQYSSRRQILSRLCSPCWSIHLTGLSWEESFSHAFEKPLTPKRCAKTLNGSISPACFWMVDPEDTKWQNYDTFGMQITWQLF
jgi:hypothetical protein